MGADNISIIAVFPNPIRQAEINKMRKYLLEVKVFIAGLTGDQRAALQASMQQDVGTCDLVTSICEVNGHKFSKETRQRIADAIVEFLVECEEITYPEFLDNDPPYGTGYRDSVSRTVRLGGKTWDIISAGELSWGDEPQGKGFQELKLAFRWGVVRMLGGQ